MNPTIETAVQLKELLKEFNDIWNIKKNSSSCISLFEAENLLENLKLKTDKLYLEMINKYIQNIDERELIGKKKQNLKLKESNLEIQKKDIKEF